MLSLTLYTTGVSSCGGAGSAVFCESALASFVVVASGFSSDMESSMISSADCSSALSASSSSFPGSSLRDARTRSSWKSVSTKTETDLKGCEETHLFLVLGPVLLELGELRAHRGVCRGRGRGRVEVELRVVDKEIGTRSCV